MCGICGEIRFDGQRPDLGAMGTTLEVLRPRGPEAEGLWTRDNVALGQRRLKIIDLSDSAGQPMVDSALGLTIVFNGAIYNYPELREELQGLGYSFFSHGDTEVLLKAYHAWGKDFVTRLNGMFAFAIWERKTGKVYLARDRLGIKPLYYSSDPKRFRFASSLPALLAPGDLPTQLDPAALHHYFTFHSVVPPPLTILKSIRKLPPATWQVIHPNGKIESNQYWELPFDSTRHANQLTFKEWKEEVHHALQDAISRRMVADVPVGVLLSGGLDSSLVVALLAQRGTKNLETFSIGFESVNEEKGDEFEYSNLIAEHFQTKHHRIPVETERVLPNLEKCVRAMSEPMTSHDNIGFYLLSEKVSQHVKVVQSGQGADEIFGGYHWYPPLLDSKDALSDYSKAFFDRNHEDMGRLLQKDWYSEDYSTAFVKQHFSQGGATEPIDKALRIDTQVMLIDDPVKRVDNMTMAFGLEARVPFLDHLLVELASKVPAPLKIKGGGKYILKEVARDILPHEVIDRPKGYFPVPALKYLQGPYLKMVQDLLHQPAAQERGLFQKDYVETLLADPEKHITPLKGSKLWQVAMLEFWLQTHGI